MALTKVPDKSTLVDGQFVQVEGPNQLLSGFQYDLQTSSLYTKESQVVFPSRHGTSHVAEDPVPNATCDTPGLLSADDKCKLDTLLQTRVGVLGFQGAGFPDDGGWMQGDIILAAGTEFISLERIGNVVRFTVDSPVPLNCACEECVQLFWVQDETDVSAIRPPTCGGKLPGVNAYGEMKVYLFPESAIVDPANPATTLNQKGQYPSLIFKRFDDAIVPGSAELDLVLKRHSVNLAQTEIGWAFTPGASGKVECVWFTGLDDDGNLASFELDTKGEPGLLGSVLYKGHMITKQMGVIVDYTPTVLTTNQYAVRFWNVLVGEPVGDSFTATNVWRYLNPENPVSGSNPKSLLLDVTTDILPIGQLVSLWAFQVGEISGEPIIRHFFREQPNTNPANLWGMVGGVQFGDSVQLRGETEADIEGSEDKTAAVEVSGVDDFEPTIWGLTGFDVPLMLFDTVESEGTEGATINLQHRAVIDTDLPGLRVVEDAGTEPFSQRPVMLWNRNGMANSMLVRAEIGRPTASTFSPFDVLVHAPIDNKMNEYMKVAAKGTVDGVGMVRIKGVHWNDMPQTGTLRVISPGNNRNKIFNYYNKLIFPSVDEDSLVLMSSAADNESFPGDVGEIVELVHKEFTSPCVRVEFTVDGSGAIMVQFKVGILGMDTPYENDLADDIDDFVRGLRPGYAVSAVYSQDSAWSGVGTQPDSSVDGFFVYDGGEASDGNEYWNLLEVMLRAGQVWIWWNGLLVPPSTALSAALPTPVQITTAYFPITTGRVYGKYGMRMWPGASLRRTELRSQPRVFSEFTYGQLELA